MLTDPNLAIAAILIEHMAACGIYYDDLCHRTSEVLKDILEAFIMDGASQITTLLKIKVLMIANTTACIFLTLVNSFKQFDLNLAITNGAPSRILAGKPVQATGVSGSEHIYGYQQEPVCAGTDESSGILIILAIVSLTQVSIRQKKEVEM